MMRIGAPTLLSAVARVVRWAEPHDWDDDAECDDDGPALVAAAGCAGHTG